MDGQRESFRPARALGWSSALAGLFWFSVLLYLTTFPQVAFRSFLSTIFFVVFFSICCWYYSRVAIFVDEQGLTYRGMVKTHRLVFEDIRQLQVLPGLVTVYAVETARDSVHFTSFFSKHQRLAEILKARAHLGDRR